MKKNRIFLRVVSLICIVPIYVLVCEYLISIHLKPIFLFSPNVSVYSLTLLPIFSLIFLVSKNKFNKILGTILLLFTFYGIYQILDAFQ